MVDVTAVSGASTVTQPAQTAKASAVDYDAFLKLLVAELKNQDPTKPMESTEYIAQLASFSGVEQSIQTNEKLDKLLSASFITNAGSLIGRTVTSSDGSISGKVEQVKVSDGVGIAVLTNGEQLSIDSTVTVSS